MNKYIHKFLIALFIIVGVSGEILAQNYIDGKKKGAIRVKMNATLQASLKSIKSTRKGVETGIVPFDAVSNQVSAKEMKRVFRFSPKFEERHQASGLHLWYEIEFDPTLDPKEVAKQYAQLDEVKVATVIPQVTLIGSEAIVNSSVSSTESTFNDPLLGDQWHYNNDGSQSWAEAGADINLAKAWEIETGSSDVIVAIIDGGINVEHPDLIDALWTNDAELNGIEGIDDDGNGFVDDIYGYNFVLGQGNITTHYHGTHVAGTVGAVNNNQEGVAGIAGGNGSNLGVRLMSCQIFTEEGGAGGYAEAIVYAADMGAVIGQNSWGWSTDGAYDQAVLDAIDYFNANAGSYAGSPMKGGVSIFAAGNLGYELDIYPAAYEPCIAVAAMGPDFKKAPYSVFADWVDVTAPGGNASLAKEAQVLSTYSSAYGYLQGTSMACPHVSGIAALVVSKFKADEFTADQLKQHLLTSVHDINPYLTDLTTGKMGNGYIDAYLALQSGDPSIVPNAVTDLSVETAQDFATFFWSVPVDADDEKAVSYNLYWSKEPFTEANIQAAGSKVVNEFYANVGDQVTHTIEGLDAQTTYYFAIKAFDRWGNGSSLSNVISVATNNGPEITMGNPLEFDIDVQSNPISNQIFTFENTGEGVLNWQAHLGLDTLSLTPFTTKQVTYPAFDNAPVLTGVGADDIIVDGLVAAPSYESIDERLRYVEYSTNATKRIGENDTTITNSAATWYKVDNDEGFNLTNMWLNLQVDPQTGPIVIEIWKGSVLKDATLLSAQNYLTKTAFWTSHYIELEEQINFEKGDVFWVVVHIPSGNLYPLGIAEEDSDEYSERCFISFNGGSSWSPLAAEINKDIYVWSWVMRSSMNDLGEYITLSPQDGVLTSGSSQDIALEINADNLIDGYYEDNLVVISNDPANKVARGKIKFNVTGHQPILSSSKTVDFGNVFVGDSKTLDIQIVNKGLRGYQLLEDGYTSSNSDIFIPEGVVSGETIPALDEGWVRVTFAPDNEGIFNSIISITNEQGYTHQFTVHGVSVSPADILVADTESDTSEVVIPGGLTVGDAIANRTFTITNNGHYPLHYKVPKFSPDYEVEGLIKPANNFGYTYDYVLADDNADPVAHNWEDIISSGTSLMEELRGPKYAVEREIGFSFPFRDRFYNKVWINEQGALIFGEEGDKNLDWVTGSEITPIYLRDFDMITATMMAPKMRDNTEISYRQEDGMFRVQYKNILYGSTVGVNMQIVLHANGDVDILFYKSVYNPSYLISIIDRDNKDIALIHNSQYPVPMANGIENYNQYKEFFHFYHPGENLITNVTNPSGTVQPGESASLEVSFNTEGVLQDSIYERLAIVSNDPDLPVTKYTVSANFVAGGSAQLTAEDESIDFGDVFKTDSVIYVTSLTNSGTAPISITDLAFQTGGLFTTEKIDDLPIVVKARQSVHLPVKINTGIQADPAAGTVNDVLIVTDENSNTNEIALQGTIIENPIINVSPVEGITQTLVAGETIERQFTISNDGDGELEYAIVPGTWFYLKDTNQPQGSEIKDFDYVHEKGDGIGYVDITESAAHTNLESKFLDDRIPYFKLPLKNDYPYYGQKYDTLYISVMGWMSFIEPEIEALVDRPTNIPEVDNMKGAIAPMAAFHLPYYYSQRQKQGVYYQEEEDRVIVSWEDFFPLAGGRIEYSFQAIIYSNGKIEFNYKDLEYPNIAAVVGVEKPNEEEGLLIWRDYMPSMPNDSELMSYSVFPVVKQQVAPNSSATVDMILDATVVNDGTYSSNIIIKNNSVGEIDQELPVELTVIGTPNLEVKGNNPEYVWYVEGKSYDFDLTIENTGTKTVTVDHEELTANPEIELFYVYPEVLNSRGNVLAPAGEIPINEFVGQIAYVEIWSKLGPVKFEVGDGTKLAPGDNWKMVMRYTPSSPAQSVSTFKLFDTNLAEVFSSQLLVESKMPPAITISEDNITEYAVDDSYTGNRNLVIGNINGSGDLEWNIDLIFNRGKQDAESTASPSLKSSGQLPQLYSGTTTETAQLKSTNENTYNRSITYTDELTKNNNIGFGAGLSFMSATKFKAPDDGFYLSDIETYYVHESVLSGVITVEIKAGGDNIYNASVIGKGSLSLAYDAPDADVGEYVSINLNEPVFIYPNEDFYVVITYPLGVTKPQGVVFTEMENIVADRFFFNYQGDWFDMVTQGGFENMAFMVKAHELNYEQRTWLTIEGDVTGTTVVGQESEVKLNFNAAFAQEIKNNAQLVIISNDPIDNEKVVDVNLLMNEAPYVVLSEGDQKVEENQTTTLTFSVVDNEGDSFTNEVITDADWITYTDNNSEIILNLAPDYYAQGIHTIQIITKDEHDVERNTSFEIQVINVNRSPELTESAVDTTVVWEHGDFELIFSDLINDVDNDEMTYTIQVIDEDVLAMMYNNGRAILTPQMIGSSEVQITGRDQYGASVKGSFIINVIHRTAIDDNELNRIEIYPNPATDFIRIDWKDWADGDVMIRLTNAAGEIIQQKNVQVGLSATYTMIISDLAKGLYMMEVISDEQTHKHKIIKQ
ncbi:subtilase family N-terminal domain-containing protein [Carboxylicivirga linearis]|uniref:S8 family serine peptidase n=1 Tax=Carboxylicivirga linearis TaxID=1628157 RepID=A0ABS5JZQ6_9BACT|nr:subtilase family N-terminal domain-containing protein [Carboxylicivirga linearis]MBS2100394.1 S8 family serine peptidase [Carboxylicivirga linearis]